MSPLESTVLELRERKKLDHDPWTLLDFEHQIKEEGRIVLPELPFVGDLLNFHSITGFGVNRICCWNGILHFYD